MSQIPILILITPRRIAVARLGRDGTIAASASEPIAGGLKPEFWSTGLTELDAPLASALTHLGRTRGGRAKVLYHGPESVSELVRVPTGDITAAREATELAIADVASFSIAENASEITVIQRAEGLTLTLGAADQSLHLDALAGLLSRAGLKADGFCPITAALIAGLAAQSARIADSGASLHVHIGEDQSTLLTRQRGTIELARSVELGIAHLVDALATHQAQTQAPASTKPESTGPASTGPASTTAGDPPDGAVGPGAAEPSAADRRAAARTILMEHGLSSGTRRQNAMDRSLMVAIQPVLQRMVVEMRQTLRFGFGDTACQGAQIVMHGPITRVPGLVEYMAEALSDEISLAPSEARAIDLDLACAQAGTKAPNLLPPDLTLRRAVRRVRNLAAVGTALALGLVAMEYQSVSKTLSAEQVLADDASTRLVEARERSALLAASRTEETRVAQTLASLRSAFGAPAFVAPALQAVADAAPEQLRLVDIRLADASSGPVLTLDGIILGGSERAAADALRAYVRRLESTPSFASVRLGATRSVRVDGHPAQKFTIEATLTSIPAFALEETQ